MWHVSTEPFTISHAERHLFIFGVFLLNPDKYGSKINMMYKRMMLNGTSKEILHFKLTLNS